MKNVIVALALILVILMYEGFQGNFNSASRQREMMKDSVDFAASSASLSINKEYYGDGWIVYDYEIANKEAEKLLMGNTGSRHFDDRYKLYTYFFDYGGAAIGDSLASSGALHSFADSKAVGTGSFKWGDRASTCTDIKEKTGKDFIVDSPCVACIAQGGRITKLSLYEYKTD